MKGCLVSDSRGDANILFRHQHQVLKTNMKGIFSPKVVGVSGMAWIFQRHHCWKRLSLQKTGHSLPPKVFFYGIVFNSYRTHIKGSLGQFELLKLEGLCQDFR